MPTEKAHAKINLTLDIVGRRGDGYHLLETVMQTVSLFDTVTVEKAEGITLTCSEADIPTDSKNTCYRAAELFISETGAGGAKIHIEKRIPSRAGLGGGSSDAAAVLRAMNRLCGFPLTREKLINIAAKVGADVPFCVDGGCAVCRGIGEKIEPVSGFGERYILLVKPDFGISTPEAYRLFDEKALGSVNGTAEFCSLISRGADPCPAISNDIERAVDSPIIKKIKRELIKNGARAAEMTGSGSCVYGVFDGDKSAADAEKSLKGAWPFVCLCRTISAVNSARENAGQTEPKP